MNIDHRAFVNKKITVFFVEDVDMGVTPSKATRPTGHKHIAVDVHHVDDVFDGVANYVEPETTGSELGEVYDAAWVSAGAVDGLPDVLREWHEYRISILSNETDKAEKALLSLLRALQPEPNEPTSTTTSTTTSPSSSSSVETLMSCYDAHNIMMGKIAMWTMLETHLGSGVNQFYGFSPLSNTFWRVVTVILSHMLPTDKLLTVAAVDILWLASFHAPSPANSTMVSLLAQLDDAELNRVSRFGALVHQSTSVQAHVQQLIAKTMPLSTSTIEKLTRLQCDLVLSTDLADGECGGNDVNLVLERLQFHARTMHYRLGCEGMWNCEPCVAPSSLVSFSPEEQVSRQLKIYLLINTF